MALDTGIGDGVDGNVINVTDIEKGLCAGSNGYDIGDAAGGEGLEVDGAGYGEIGHDGQASANKVAGAAARGIDEVDGIGAGSSIGCCGGKGYTGHVGRGTGEKGHGKAGGIGDGPFEGEGIGGGTERAACRGPGCAIIRGGIE